MSALIAVLCGFGVGYGVFLMMRAAFGTRRTELETLPAVLTLVGSPVASVTGGDALVEVNSGLDGYQGSLSRAGLAFMRILSFVDTDSLKERLRVLDKSIEQHAYEKMIGATAGFCFPVFGAVVIAAAGISVPVLTLLVVAAVLAIAGFVYPDVPLKEQVEKRRTAFRHALSSYLDLVTILLAGGAGTESALEGAAEAGDGWAFGELRRALRRAQLTRRTPWEVFEELGAELGVVELQEIAASVSLAGGQGARVKQTLSSRADAMRVRQAAEIEAAAEAQTEKMIVPVVVMVIGLVMFIGFGAVEAISGDVGADITDPQVGTPVQGSGG